jgi:hypothetical protein
MRGDCYLELRRISLPRTSVNKGKKENKPARLASDRKSASDPSNRRP